MTWKKRMAVLLGAALIVSGSLAVPGAVDNASAGQGRYGINIGAGALRGSDAGWSASGGMTVYYGTYSGGPMRYRVLPSSPGTQAADEESLLLDADTVIALLPFHNSDEPGGGQASGNPNEWSGSEIQAYLSGLYEKSLSGAEGALFSSAEAGAIADTALGSASYEGDLDVLYASCMDYASSGHLFLLSAKEAQTLYSGNDARIKAGGNNMWWLRSANIPEPMYAGYVMPDGKISIMCVDFDMIGVSPALNLRLSAVLFSSAVDKTAAPENGAVGPSGSTEWKLTLRDPGKYAGVTGGEAAGIREDGTVLVPYTYVDDSGQNPVNQISVMITDQDYRADGARILYYGALQDIRNESGESAAVRDAKSGTGTFVLPEDLPKGYRVYLLAECVSGGWYTDYAGEPSEIYLEPEEETESESELESETGALTAAEMETEAETESQSESQAEGATEGQSETTASETEMESSTGETTAAEAETEIPAEGETSGENESETGQTEEMSEGMTEGQTGETTAAEAQDEIQPEEAKTGTNETENQTENLTEGQSGDQTGEPMSGETENGASEISGMTEGQTGETAAGEAETVPGQTGTLAAASGLQDRM